MFLSRKSCGFIAVSILAFAGHAAAGQLHHEGMNGDLSNDRLNPTAFTLAMGSNTLAAASVAGDREYVRLNVPTWLQLTSVMLTEFQTQTNVSFIGVQQGTTMTVDPTAGSPAGLLGYTHFGTANVGTDILPAIGTGPGSLTFAPPLNAGSYVFWIQETSTLPSAYTFDFVTVPAPGGCVVMGMMGVIASRRRR